MILTGDCVDLLGAMPSNSADALVSDPPYGLSEGLDAQKMLKEWLAGRDYKPSKRGFAGREWDAFVPSPRQWLSVLNVLKPGAFGAVFASSRTLDLTTLSMRLAGFEVKDTLFWIYGSGFPKSLNVGVKNPEWDGFGTALKPAYEPILLVRKPTKLSYVENLKKYGTGALNIDACRVEDKARWPANIMHDGFSSDPFWRYFYCAKATPADRDDGLAGHVEPVSPGEILGRKAASEGLRSPRAGAGRNRSYLNPHPTVKPTPLMSWLTKLVTPPKKLVLDPFAGSGSTWRGCRTNGLDFIGCELDPNYVKIAKLRAEAIR